MELLSFTFNFRLPSNYILIVIRRMIRIKGKVRFPLDSQLWDIIKSLRDMTSEAMSCTSILVFYPFHTSTCHDRSTISRSRFDRHHAQITKTREKTEKPNGQLFFNLSRRGSNFFDTRYIISNRCFFPAFAFSI